MTEYYKDIFNEADDAHPWYYPADYIDELVITGAELGANLKVEPVTHIDEWLW